jgi:tetratricopeptide (TPR) repeat protein
LITSSFWSRLRLRNDSLAQGAAAKTLEILERSIANDPSAASKLARLYFEEKQYSRAEELSKRALSSFESLQGAWITLGDCQAQRRAFDDARISFLKARSLDPADPVPFLRLAELARITGRPQFAVQLLAAARDRFKQRSTEHAKRYWLTMSSSVFVRNDMFPSALLPEAAEYGGEIASLKRIRDIASQLQQVQFVELVDDCLSSRSLP